MKLHPVFPKTTILLLTVASLLASCKKIDQIKAPPSNTFKPELFREELEKQLTDAMGYGMVITQDGQIAETASSGIGSITRMDTLPFDINSYINIASVTKTLTATVVLRYMRSQNVDLDSAIGKWLPETWSKNAQISNLKFRELLRHRSGIRTGGTSWASLKNVVANPLEGSKDRKYANVNLALFRAILPKLDNPSLFSSKQNTLAPADFESWMSQRYIAIIQENLFNKIGLSNRACEPKPGQVQMFNEQGSLNTAPTGDWTDICGGGGFYLSTRDMAKFIVYLVHTDDFLVDEERAVMESDMIGWWGKTSVTGGFAYGHDGALYVDTDNSGGLSPADPGLQTLIMKFPNKVELALSINSLPGSWRNLYEIAKVAYNNAWVVE